MLINIKAQVDVKVRPGSKGATGDAMMDQLADGMERLLQNFLESRGQDPEAYTFQVKLGTTTMIV